MWNQSSSYLLGLLAACLLCVSNAGRMTVHDAYGQAHSSDLEWTSGMTQDFTDGVLETVDLAASINQNCLPEVLAAVQALQASFQAMPSKLEDAKPMFAALKSVTDILQNPTCLQGASEPLPAGLSQAVDFVSSGAGAMLFENAAWEATQEFFKAFNGNFEKRCYKCVGQDVGNLLQVLASQAGTVPMLNGLASALDGANDGASKLNQCVDVASEGWIHVRSLQKSLSVLLPRRHVFHLPHFGVKKLAGDLEEMAEAIESMKDVLDKCMPGRFASDQRITGFKAALTLADDVFHTGESLVLMGFDIFKEIKELRAAAAHGEWNDAGKMIGHMTVVMSSAHNGLNAVDVFLKSATGAGKQFGEALREVQVCLQGSQDFVDTCKGTFAPISASAADPLDKGSEAARRLGQLLESMKELLPECKELGAKSLGKKLGPEFELMSSVIETGIARAQKDTDLVARTLNTVKVVRSVGSELDTLRFGDASDKMGALLTIVNDNINTDSFLQGILATVGSEAQTLPECVGDVRRIMSNLRIAAFAIEISPRKWTIDKGDCDTAMTALKAVVEASHDMLASCSEQIQALQQLLTVTALQKLRTALVAKKWLNNGLGKIHMFSEDIVKPLWQLAQAIAGRDWVAAGQAVGALALKALNEAHSDS